MPPKNMDDIAAFIDGMKFKKKTFGVSMNSMSSSRWKLFSKCIGLFMKVRLHTIRL